MGLPKEIADLIERFDRNLEAYKGGQYNEAQLRQDLLNPFLGALGWDKKRSARKRSFLGLFNLSKMQSDRRVF